LFFFIDQALNLQMDTPFAALIALLCANIFFRFVASWILQYRLRGKDQLREIPKLSN
jgi:hypothetical protein